MADDARPLTRPTRDVEVTYAISQGQQQMQERSRWQGATGRQRVDSPAGGVSYMISDPLAGRVFMVSDATRKVIDIIKPRGPMDGGAGVFLKLGHMVVAGLGCTEWAITPPEPSTTPRSQICLTDDGVLLNLRVGDVQQARATTVTYAPLDPALFAVPQDYVHMTAQPAR